MPRRIRVLTAGLAVLWLAGAAGAAPAPEDTPLPEGKETTVACRMEDGGKEWHYRVYIPQGYQAEADAGRTYPVLVISSPGGNARMGLMADWIKRNGFLAIMLVEAKNGPWEPIINNFQAAYADARRRLRMNPTLVFGTGFSGGARAASMYNHLLIKMQCPPMSGVVLQGAGTAGDATLADLVKAKVPTAFVAGCKDGNRTELSGLKARIPAPLLMHRQFDGGHQWAPKEVVESCLDWVWSLAWRNPRTQLTKADLLARVDEVLEASGGGRLSPLQQYNRLASLKQMAARQRLAADAAGKAAVKRIAAELAKRSADANLKKELAARNAYGKVAAREAQLESSGQVGPQAREYLAMQYGKVAEWFPGTEYGNRAAEKAKAPAGG